jgi:hypothetical protein
MFTIKLIKVMDIHKFITSVMLNRDTKYLKELEKQVDDFINKYEQILCLNGTIEDVLDIRDAIILRQCKLKREAVLRTYLHSIPQIEYVCGCVGLSFCINHRQLNDRKQILKCEITYIDKILDSREML